jgi:uncharacterized protein YndB with AHSA1/START domain
MTTATDVLVEIKESIHVEAPPGTVWGCVCDISRHPQYAGPKSITKEIEFDGEIVPGAQWVSHERFGPQKFDAPSEITEVEAGRHLAWVSFPPFKEENRGDGGRVFWSYTLEPEHTGTRLTHHMQVLPPQKGAAQLKAMYAVFRLPTKQRRGVHTTLQNIKSWAEAQVGQDED